MKKPKKKLCKLRGCKVRFTPPLSRPLQSVCSPTCAWKYEEQKKSDKKKSQRKLDKKRLLDLKPLSFFAGKAEKACNKWIRMRDEGKPCISCGITYGEFHAGHFRSVGACKELRYHPSNINRQCSQCNRKKSGNIIEYRKALVSKVGVEVVEYLENFNEMQFLTREDFEDIEEFYKDRIRHMW